MPSHTSFRIRVHDSVRRTLRRGSLLRTIGWGSRVLALPPQYVAFALFRRTPERGSLSPKSCQPYF